MSNKSGSLSTFMSWKNKERLSVVVVVVVVVVLMEHP